MSFNAREYLDGYNANTIRQWTDFHGLTVGSNKKAPHILALERHLFNERAVKSALDKLSRLERELLDRLVLRGGAALSSALKREMLQAGLLGETPTKKSRYGYSQPYEGHPSRTSSRAFEDVAARLTAHGLVLTAGVRPGSQKKQTFNPGERLFIPEPVLQHLPPVSRQVERVDERAIQRAVEAPAADFQRDVYLYWDFARREPVSLTKRGLVSKRQLRRIVDLMRVPESLDGVRDESGLGRTRFLRQVMTTAGLFREAGATVEPSATAGERFFRQSLTQRTADLYRAWLKMPGWNELLRIPDLTIDFNRNRDRRAGKVVQDARAFVVDLLKDLTTPEQADVWLSALGIVKEASRTKYEFLFPRNYRSASTYYSYSYGYGYQRSPYTAYNNALSWDFGIRDEAEGWGQVEAGFIWAVLTEPLHWLGLLDLAYGSDDRLLAMRLTPLGQVVIAGLQVPVPEPTGGRLVVQPNFQIFALEPIGEHVLAVLDRFAERVRAERGAFEYRLIRDSVYAAQQGGMKVIAMIAFLERESGAELPQNIARTLEEWGEKHERIVFRPGATVLEAQSEALLDQMLADPAVERLVARRLTSTVALLRSDADVRGALVPVLLAQGELTAVTRRAAPRPALRLSEKGLVHLAPSVPTVHLMRHLEPLTERRGEALVIAPQAVKAAVAAGTEVEDILKTLAAWHRGPLPQRLVESITSWSRYYGEAELSSVVLLRVQDEDVLKELRRDGRLRRLLKPFKFEGALAVVDAADVEAVRQALEERGFVAT